MHRRAPAAAGCGARIAAAAAAGDAELLVGRAEQLLVPLAPPAERWRWRARRPATGRPRSCGPLGPRQRRWAYSSSVQRQPQEERRYDTGRTDGAAANYIKHKYKLHRTEIKGKRLWEIKSSTREIMDQGRALIGELRAMRGAGWHIGLMTYTSAISVFASYGLSKWAHRMLEEMKRDGLTPALQTYNALLWAYAENGELRGIQAVWKEMNDQGVKPDNISYNVVLMGLLRGGHRDVVFRVFDLMIADGMNPDVQMYNTLVTACSTAEEGWAVVERMKRDKVRPDQFTFYFLMKLSARIGDVRGAEDVLRQLAANHVTPNSTHWTVLLSTYRTAGDFQGCLRVWDRMKDAGVKPNSGALAELFRAQEQEEDNQRERARKAAPANEASPSKEPAPSGDEPAAQQAPAPAAL